MIMRTKFWSDHLKKSDYLEELGTNGRTNKIQFKKIGNRVWRCGVDSSGSVQRPNDSSCKHGKGPWGSNIVVEEFLDELFHYQLFKKEYAPWS
jgi:hypothetical protein